MATTASITASRCRRKLARTATRAVLSSGFCSAVHSLPNNTTRHQNYTTHQPEYTTRVLAAVSSNEALRGKPEGETGCNVGREPARRGRAAHHDRSTFASVELVLL